MRILLYQAQQMKVGGVESFNLNFVKRMSKYYDIIFVCDTGDPYQLAEIEKYVPVYIYEGQYFETDLCIISSAWGKRPVDHINAKKFVQMIHADYELIERQFAFKYIPIEKKVEHWGGGKNICEAFTRKYGLPCKEVRYLLDPDIKVEPVLRLITVSRIAKGKGFDRIAKLAKLLKSKGRKFIWHIWGESHDEGYEKMVKESFKDVPEVVFHGLGRNLYSYIADADYSVTMSDTEGYAFQIYESLKVNTPVISTNFPNAREQITDGVNGYIVDYKLDRFTDEFIEQLYTKKPKFEFKDIVDDDDWIKILGKPGKRTKTRVTQPKNVKIEVINDYLDMRFNKRMKRGQIFEVSEERANELENKNLVKKLFFIN